MAAWRNFALIFALATVVTYLELVAYWRTSSSTGSFRTHHFIRELGAIDDLETFPSAWNLSREPSVISERDFPDAVATTEGTHAVRRFLIHAGAKCGSEGFSVDPKKDDLPRWAEGSIRFPDRLSLSDPEPSSTFFREIGSLVCYSRGTDLTSTLPGHTACSCRPGYHGHDCGVPSPVWFTARFQKILPEVKRRPAARRVIHGVPVNHELKLMDARLRGLSDSVTVYLISESDFTAAGVRKDRFFERRAREDPAFLGPFRSRTLLLRMDHFPPKGCIDGWVADSYLRTFLGKEGLQRLDGLRSDDLFLLTDADEIPRKDVVDFLRLYEGFGEPVGLNLRWFVYGFFWEKLLKNGNTEQTRVEASCTVGMLQEVYGGDPVMIRKRMWQKEDTVNDKWRQYQIGKGRVLRPIEIGSVDHPAGYHCSWCFDDAEGIRVKLGSAQLADGPRWGNYQEKMEPSYLERLVKDGEWFDGSKSFALRDLMAVLKRGKEHAMNFVPPYVLEHFDDYYRILVHPSEWSNGTLMDEYRKLIGGMFAAS